MVEEGAGREQTFLRIQKNRSVDPHSAALPTSISKSVMETNKQEDEAKAERAGMTGVTPLGLK